MRFSIKLQLLPQYGRLLPFSYQYELSSLIYKILAKSDQKYSEWLHENGFALKDRKFKLFSFSRLKIENWKPQGQNILILSNTLEWQISFLHEKSTQEFIQGIFADQFVKLGHGNAIISMNITGVELLPEPKFSETMVYSANSPICLTKRIEGSKYPRNVSPDDKIASTLILGNLLTKYEALNGEKYVERDFIFSFEAINKPKSSLITIKAGTGKQTRIRGYFCDFKLTAPIELHKIMYNAGIGGKNSTGFGFVTEREESKKSPAPY